MSAISKKTDQLERILQIPVLTQVTFGGKTYAVRLITTETGEIHSPLSQCEPATLNKIKELVSSLFQAHDLKKNISSDPTVMDREGLHFNTAAPTSHDFLINDDSLVHKLAPYIGLPQPAQIKALHAWQALEQIIHTQGKAPLSPALAKVAPTADNSHSSPLSSQQAPSPPSLVQPITPSGLHSSLIPPDPTPKPSPLPIEKREDRQQPAQSPALQSAPHAAKPPSQPSVLPSSQINGVPDQAKNQPGLSLSLLETPSQPENVCSQSPALMASQSPRDIEPAKNTHLPIAPSSEKLVPLRKSKRTSNPSLWAYISSTGLALKNHDLTDPQWFERIASPRIRRRVLLNIGHYRIFPHTPESRLWQERFKNNKQLSTLIQPELHRLEQQCREEPTLIPPSIRDCAEYIYNWHCSPNASPVRSEQQIKDAISSFMQKEFPEKERLYQYFIEQALAEKSCPDNPSQEWCLKNISRDPRRFIEALARWLDSV